MPEADLVVQGARVLAPDGATHDGGVAVRDGRLVCVGSDRDLAHWVEGGARTLHAGGQLLAPGFCNTHCHSGDSLFRGLIEGLPLEPWLQGVFRAEREILDDRTAELGSLLGLAENLLAGVTSVVDMFWYPRSVARAAQQLGVRVTTGGMFFDGEGIDGRSAEERESDARAFCVDFADNPLVTAGINPHAAYTVSPPLLETVARLAEETGAIVSIHAAETRLEQQTIQERYGRPVIEHLDTLGLLGPRTILAHCVHLSEHELELIASSGSVVAHNPVSNLKLGSGIAPVPDMLERGVHVTLGTDGPISGNDLDPWLGLRLAAILHKGALGDPTAVAPQTAWAMATRRGAEALGLGSGTLEVGEPADFILVDLDRPHARPLFDAVHHLVFSAGRGDVTHVFVNGNEVVRDRKLTQIDLSALLEEAQALAPHIMGTLGASS